MGILRTEKLSYEYTRYGEEDAAPQKICALSDVELDVAKGEFIVILGHNGSGKSTLARHINALLLPTEGTVWVDGMDTRREENTFAVRQKAGMVFQNPDNQIIASVIEEDVGFGPENIGVPAQEIWERVDYALSAVGMTAYREASPDYLSGGQKQRVAIAGILAMKPECIVLDEPTAMLDPGGRKEVLKTVRELNRKEGVTVILITHYLEEAVEADRIFVMDKGSILFSGTPREIFSRSEELRRIRLDVPQITELADRLRARGLLIPKGILTVSEFTDAVMELTKTKQC